MESTVEGTKEMQNRISRFRELHEQNPGARYFAPLADLLRQQGQHDEALRLLGEGLRQHDNYLAGLVIQGRTLQEVGRGDEAHETWQQVRRIDPDNILALEFLAGRAVEQGDWERAESLLEHLCRLLPTDSPWCGHLEQVRREAEQQRISQQARAADQAGGSGGAGEDSEPGGERQNTGGSFETMTLVDIYLAQGYREQALSVLKRMLPGAGAAEPEILERIRRLENVDGEDGPRATVTSSSRIAGDEPEADLEDPQHEPSAVAAGARYPRRLSAPEREQRQEDRARRREEERRQFEAWLARIRLDGEEN